MIQRMRFDKYSALYLWALFMIVFTITQGSTFLSWTSLELVLTDPAVYNGTLALAFLVPLATGTYDLSIGANMSLALVISSYLASTDKTSDILAMVIALCACAVAGFVSGFFVVRLKVNSFIATLGMSQVITAVVQKISDQSINDAFTDSYRNIGRQELFGLPLYWYFMMILAVIVWYVFEHTPVGRHMFAVGGNPEAARLAGLRSDRLVWGSLVASAVIAGFAGIIYAGRSATTRPPWDRDTSSRRSRRCSSVPRSCAVDRTSGARSSPCTPWHGASRACN